MAHHLHQVAGAAALETLWFNLLNAPRRALCELAYIDPQIGEQFNWQKIPVEYRVRLIRAMKALSEVSVDCAVALEIARTAIETSDARH